MVHQQRLQLHWTTTVISSLLFVISPITTITTVHSLLNENTYYNNITTSTSSSESNYDLLQEQFIRTLAIGDFDTFNNQIKDLRIQIPDSSQDSTLLDISISNIECTNIYIGDIQSSWELYTNDNVEITTGYKETLALTYSIVPFGIDCTASYNYKTFGFISGSGTLKAISTNSNAIFRFDFNSLNGFATDFPSNLDVHTCETVVSIDNVNFDGTLGDNLLNAAQNAIGNIVERQANALICPKLQQLVPESLNPFLVNATQNLLNLTTGGNTDSSNTINIDNPLQYENDYIPSSSNVTLVNFLQSSDTVNASSSLFSAEKLILLGLEFIQETFAGTTGNTSNSSTLKATEFISQFVNENGILIIDYTNVQKSTTTLIDTSSGPILLINISDPTGFYVSLQTIRVSGLDTINSFELLNPIGKYTLENKIQFEKISIEIDIQIIIIPSTNADGTSIIYSPNPLTITENVTITLTLDNLIIAASLFVPIDTNKIGAIAFGNILNSNNIVPCVLSILDDFVLSGLQFDYSNKDNVPIVISNVSNVGIQNVIQKAIEASLAAFEPTFIKLLPNYIQQYFYNAYNQGCPASSSSSTTKSLSTSTSATTRSSTSTNTIEVIDFRDLLLSSKNAYEMNSSSGGTSPYGDLIQLVYQILQNFIKINPTTLLSDGMNTIITNNFAPNGVYKIVPDLLNTQTIVKHSGLYVDFKIRAYDAYIRHIDTIGGNDFTVLSPTSKTNPSILNNSAAFGIHDKDFILGMNLLVGLANNDTNILNDFAITVRMRDLQVIATLLLKMSLQAFYQFPLQDLSNINCWLATIPAPELDMYGVRSSTSEQTMGIVDFRTIVDNLRLNVTCRNCTGPLWSEFSSLIGQNEDKVQAMAQTLIDIVTDLIKGDYVAVQFDRMLNNAPKLCPHNPQYNPAWVQPTYQSFELVEQKDSLSFLFILVTICGTLLIAVLVIYLATRCIVRRRHKRWISTLNQQQLDILYRQQQKHDTDTFTVNNTTKSIFTSPAVPCWIRYFMPLAIIGNILFFVSGHFSLGASVTILLSLGGETLRSDDFFQFSIAKSMVEIWNAGGEVLAVLMFLSSILWPYTKSIITLVIWFLPTRFLSVKTRGSTLLWLDTLAKWSVVDIFVLVVTIVCLKVQIKSPNVDYIPDGLYQVDLLVIPKWGLYANMIAQLICQITSHYIIYYHRRIVTTSLHRQVILRPIRGADTIAMFEDEQNESVDSSEPPMKGCIEEHYLMSTPPQRLCSYAFQRAHKAENGKLVARRIVTPLVILTAMVIIALVVLGCVMPTFSVVVLGLIGVLVESGQGFVAADTNYSMFGLLEVMFAQARMTATTQDYVGLGSLAVLVVGTVLVVPVVQACALLVQWFMQLNFRQRKRLSLTIEILQAWQYMEVYLLSVVVAAWQLGPISSFIVNPFCRSLKDFFAQLVFFGLLKEEDAQCLKTDINVSPTFYVLFVAAVCLHLLNTFVVNAVQQYVRDLELRRNSTNSNNTNHGGTLQQLSSFESNNNDEFNGSRGDIKPVPVLYTDKFRWLLRRQDPLDYSRDVNDHEPQDEGYEVESIHKISYNGANVQETDNDNNLSTFNVFRSKGTARTFDEQQEDDQDVEEENDIDVSFNPSFPRNYKIDTNLSNDNPSTGSIVRGYSSDDQSNDVVTLNQSYFDGSCSALDATLPYVTPTNSPGILRADTDDESLDSHLFADKDLYER